MLYCVGCYTVWAVRLCELLGPAVTVEGLPRVELFSRIGPQPEMLERTVELSFGDCACDHMLELSAIGRV